MTKLLRIEVAVAALLLAPFLGYGIAYLVSPAEGELPRIESAVDRTGALPDVASSARSAGA